MRLLELMLKSLSPWGMLGWGEGILHLEGHESGGRAGCYGLNCVSQKDMLKPWYLRTWPYLETVFADVIRLQGGRTGLGFA